MTSTSLGLRRLVLLLLGLLEGMPHNSQMATGGSRSSTISISWTISRTIVGIVVAVVVSTVLRVVVAFRASSVLAVVVSVTIVSIAIVSVTIVSIAVVSVSIVCVNDGAKKGRWGSSRNNNKMFVSQSARTWRQSIKYFQNFQTHEAKQNLLLYHLLPYP